MVSGDTRSSWVVARISYHSGQRAALSGQGRSWKKREKCESSKDKAYSKRVRGVERTEDGIRETEDRSRRSLRRFDSFDKLRTGALRGDFGVPHQNTIDFHP